MCVDCNAFTRRRIGPDAHGGPPCHGTCDRHWLRYIEPCCTLGQGETSVHVMLEFVFLLCEVNSQSQQEILFARSPLQHISLDPLETCVIVRLELYWSNSAWVILEQCERDGLCVLLMSVCDGRAVCCSVTLLEGIIPNDAPPEAVMTGEEFRNAVVLFLTTFLHSEMQWSHTLSRFRF